MKLQDKLEEIKKMGNYALSLTYGEDIGCDDIDVPQEDRRAIVIFNPVGCFGEVRMMFKGTLGEFLKFNLKTKPKVLSNPPKSEEYNTNGYYIWGTERSVDGILAKPFHGSWDGV